MNKIIALAVLPLLLCLAASAADLSGPQTLNPDVPGLAARVLPLMPASPNALSAPVSFPSLPAATIQVAVSPTIRSEAALAGQFVPPQTQGERAVEAEISLLEQAASKKAGTPASAQALNAAFDGSRAPQPSANAAAIKEGLALRQEIRAFLFDYATRESVEEIGNAYGSIHGQAGGSTFLGTGGWSGSVDGSFESHQYRPLLVGGEKFTLKLLSPELGKAFQEIAKADENGAKLGDGAAYFLRNYGKAGKATAAYAALPPMLARYQEVLNGLELADLSPVERRAFEELRFWGSRSSIEVTTYGYPTAVKANAAGTELLTKDKYSDSWSSPSGDSFGIEHNTGWSFYTRGTVRKSQLRIY